MRPNLTEVVRLSGVVDEAKGKRNVCAAGSCSFALVSALSSLLAFPSVTCLSPALFLRGTKISVIYHNKVQKEVHEHVWWDAGPGGKRSLSVAYMGTAAAYMSNCHQSFCHSLAPWYSRRRCQGLSRRSARLSQSHVSRWHIRSCATGVLQRRVSSSLCGLGLERAGLYAPRIGQARSARRHLHLSAWKSYSRSGRERKYVVMMTLAVLLLDEVRV